MARCSFWLSAVALVLAGSTAWGQPQIDNILTGRPLAGQAVGQGDTPDSVVSVSASYTPPSSAGRATLSINAQIQPGWHIYSLTQKPVQAVPTKITVDESPDFRVVGDFRPNLPPHVKRAGGAVFEQFEGSVTWQAPIEVKPGVDVRNLKISGHARIQTCSEVSCLQPHSFAFAARLKESKQAAASVASYSDGNGHVTFRGRIEPENVAPGGKVKLVIEATPAEHWHIYELADKDAGALGNKPTLIVLTNTSGFDFTRTAADSKAIEGQPLFEGAPPVRYHEGRVAWATTVLIPRNAKPGQYPIEGMIGYQVCTNSGCDLPRGASFSGTIVVSAAANGRGASPLKFTDAKYGQAAKLAESQTKRRAQLDEADSDTAGAASGPWTLLAIIGAGLAGGFLLNFMPCVLPVIGLKILSFAEQAGRSRAHILVLNVWYSLGVMTVFMVLALAASAASLGLAEENLSWGQQFSSTTFNVVMVALVFVMALSFLGVWEIPIPGFMNSSAANEMATREGALGAFAKGVMATILSTPCSGPFLGPVFGFLLKEPPAVTFIVFAAMGAGMSAPYLLIGAFPQLIRFLPKPGAWMETFKHIMGFVLLGTIVFLFSFMNADYIVPTFAMMVGLWAACWWIGHVSLTEPLGVKVKAWVQGATVAAVVGVVSFYWLTPHESLIAWKDFSRNEAERLSAEGNTVLVDFTADWCLSCKLNLKTAIETQDVKQSIEKNKIVPMLADWTDGSDEIKQALASIDRNSIPQLVIYPAGKPGEPIVLSDLITKRQVLDAITEAGPSKPETKSLATTAMP